MQKFIDKRIKKWLLPAVFLIILVILGFGASIIALSKFTPKYIQYSFKSVDKNKENAETPIVIKMENKLGPGDNKIHVKGKNTYKVITIRNNVPEDLDTVFLTFNGDLLQVRKVQGNLKLKVIAVNGDTKEHDLPGLPARIQDYEYTLFNMDANTVILAIGIDHQMTIFAVQKQAGYMPNVLHKVKFKDRILKVFSDSSQGIVVYTGKIKSVTQDSNFEDKTYKDLYVHGFVVRAQDYKVQNLGKVFLPNIQELMEPTIREEQYLIVTSISPFLEDNDYIIDFKSKKVSQLRSYTNCKIFSLATGVSIFYVWPNQDKQCSLPQGFYKMDVAGDKVVFNPISKQLAEKIGVIFTNGYWKELATVFEFDHDKQGLLTYNPLQAIVADTNGLHTLALPKTLMAAQVRSYAGVISYNRHLPWIDIYFPRPGIILRIYKLLE